MEGKETFQGEHHELTQTVIHGASIRFQEALALDFWSLSTDGHSRSNSGLRDLKLKKKWRFR